MGMLINGCWVSDDKTIQDGKYVRPASTFAKVLDARTIRAIETEPGRFHLIASLSCPWSHRSTLTRSVKRIGSLIPLHIAGGPRSQGYRLGTSDRLWTVPGTSLNFEHLHELYTLADPNYTGRATVAVLWDAQERTIVSNESVHIVRGLDAVRSPCGQDWTLRPDDLADQIDTLASQIQSQLSNAVYRAGKARRQDAYDEAVADVFKMLDRLEARLAMTRFLHGTALTESDIRLWPTLARFDAVYHGHFKCSRHRLVDYPRLWEYARDVHGWPGVAETFDEAAIRSAYYGEDRDINPFGIVAAAPVTDWTSPTDRGALGPSSVTLRDGRSVPYDDLPGTNAATSGPGPVPRSPSAPKAFPS